RFPRRSHVRAQGKPRLAWRGTPGRGLSGAGFGGRRKGRVMGRCSLPLALSYLQSRRAYAHVEVGAPKMRAIVLVLCLAAAGGIAFYAKYGRGGAGERVSPVPSRPEPVPRAAAAAAAKSIDPDDRAALARELQRELKRVGCYNGEITGVWTTSSRMAMKTFVE